MGETTITTPTCDVCGRKVKTSKYTVLAVYGWASYKFARAWKEGGHSGYTDCDFLACDRCHSKNVFRYMFDKITGFLAGVDRNEQRYIEAFRKRRKQYQEATCLVNKGFYRRETLNCIKQIRKHRKMKNSQQNNS